MNLKYKILEFLSTKNEAVIINELLQNSGLTNVQIQGFLIDIANTEKLIAIHGNDYMVIGSKKGQLDGFGERGLDEINVKAYITEKGRNDYSNYILSNKTLEMTKSNFKWTKIATMAAIIGCVASVIGLIKCDKPEDKKLSPKCNYKSQIPTQKMASDSNCLSKKLNDSIRIICPRESY